MPFEQFILSIYPRMGRMLVDSSYGEGGGVYVSMFEGRARRPKGDQNDTKLSMVCTAGKQRSALPPARRQNCTNEFHHFVLDANSGADYKDGTNSIDVDD